MGYVQFTAMSISISVSIFGAQAIGGGQAGQTRHAIVRTGLLLNLVLTGGLVALIYLFPRAVLGVFITDAAVLELAQRTAHHRLWSSVPFGMATVFSGAMRAGGVALAPMLLSIFAIAADRNTLGRDPEPDHRAWKGVWAAYPIVFCAMFVLQIGYYALVWRAARFGGWSESGQVAHPHNIMFVIILWTHCLALRHNAPKHPGRLP